MYDVDKSVKSERTKSIDRDKMIERIISQIEDDIPVPIMAGFNDKRIMKRIDPITGEYILGTNEKIITNKLKTHWVNIVGVKIDDIKGDTMLEVASWGEKYLVDFDDYYNKSDLIDGVIWIE